MGSGNTKQKQRQRGGERNKKELAELKSIITNLGFWSELEILYYQISDRVEEIEHGWPVVENLKKAFQTFEKTIQAKGWRKKFVSSPSYHRYQRLKNDLTQVGLAKSKSPSKNPTLPKQRSSRRNEDGSPQDYKHVLEEQLAQSQAEVKALKQQLDRQTNTTQIKEVSVVKLQEELGVFHSSRIEVDRWINKLIEQNNAVLLTHNYMSPQTTDNSDDVMESMMEEVNPLPNVKLGRKDDSKDILESTYRWMEYMATILPKYYEMKTLYDRYTKVKENVLMFGPVPPLPVPVDTQVEETPRTKGKRKKQKIEQAPAEDEGDGLVRLLQQTRSKLQQQEESLVSLEEEVEFLHKKMRRSQVIPGSDGTGNHITTETTSHPPQMSKSEEEDYKELKKRNPRNPEYLDALMTEIKNQKKMTRRLDRLKMNAIKVKLHGGFNESDIAGDIAYKNDGVDFDSLMVVQTNNKLFEDTIPELENLLMLATVGQKLLESVDVMYTHYCSDILRDHDLVLAQAGSSSNDNANVDTATNIVTKYRYKLEDIQATLLKNRDDIIKLQEEKNVLINKATELRETKKAMKVLERKTEKLSDKLARKTGTDLVREDPDVTDVIGFKKGKTIWERYNEAYEYEWFDAYELEKGYMEKPPREGIDTLLHILKDCYIYCQKEADDQWQDIRKALMWELKIERDFSESDTKYLLNVRKRYIGSTDVIEKHFREKGMSEDYLKESQDDKFKPFIRKIVELCWFMVLQDPPIHLNWDIKYADFIDKETWNNFTLNGRRYDFIVWPSMHLYKGGPLLTKGVIQPIFLD